MRGSAAFRTGVAPGGALAGPWVRNPLWNSARSVPSLDLNFANSKSLVDAATGQNLVTFTRASSGTYVDSQGVIRTATTNLIWPSEDFTTTWGVAGATRVANAGIAPNGTLTADRIESTGGGVFRSNVSVVSGVPYTYSVYIKHVSGTGVINTIGFEQFGGVSLAAQTSFNVLTGTVVSNGAAVTASSITPVGDGWYRVSVRATSTGTTAVIVNYTSVSGNQFLLWGAQLEQSSTVGEYIPTTSTINSAPRFDHNPTTGESLGLLVEEQRTNSIRNNTMVGAVAGTPGTLPTNWANNAAAGVTFSVIGTGTENGITYIDLRATTASAPSEISYRFELNTQTTAASGQSWTASTYLKVQAGSLSNITSVAQRVREFNSGGTQVQVTTQDLVVDGILRRFATTRTLSDATTTTVNSLVALSCTAGQAIDITLRIGLPQLEQGAFATSVIPTTTATVTRSADVASITGSNFGTFRTNLLLQSEDLGTTWTRLDGLQLSTNQIVAPNGSTTADLLTGNGSQIGYLEQPTASSNQFTNGITYTFSVYLKKANTSTVLTLLLGATFNSGGSNPVATWNLDTGIPSFSNGATGSMTPVGNGWYRCVLTDTATATETRNQQWLRMSSASGDVYAWGAQLETGSTATAYIPTTTAAVTVFESSWYRQDEGTVFAEYIIPALGSGTVTSFDDGTANNRWQQRFTATGHRHRLVSGGVSLIDGVAAPIPNVNIANKAAYAIKPGDQFLAANGIAMFASTGATVPTVAQLQFATGPATDVLGRTLIRRLTYFPIRLANEVLPRITQ